MENLPHFEKDIRPWGQFERFTLNEESTVKIISVNPQGKLSLQTHEKRKEFWRVISGYGTVTIGNKVEEAAPGDEFFVPKESEHRVEAGEEGLVFLEIAFGDFDENDIKRINDIYGRS
jgi:mannose-6-phosphate isomerase-like protein (cupin superfamily)